MLKPAQMFVSLNNDSDESKDNVEKKCTRQIRIHEVGEAVMKPDRIKSYLKLYASKDTVEAVKQSISRRIDYILQTLRNNNTSDVTTHQTLSYSKEDNLYTIQAEIIIEFRDIVTYENTLNFLVEKLGDRISFPKNPLFYHSTGKLTELRRQASLNAVHNSRSKALSIAQLLNQSLGSPILIQEEDVTETKGVHLGDDAVSIQSQLELNTTKVTVKVYAVFECIERLKKSI
ncbi:interleukin-1 receptor-associated kinase 1-binding protein 1 isoform X1 [Hydra vulgaris]|uniref:Interleukin-1 receptor-associated kinase 1-binding protein 1 isoform X1 n=1 Tax=Hydra vulgaris TaxID=6087 RepID=A0ABM4DIP1_HYDVU